MYFFTVFLKYASDTGLIFGSILFWKSSLKYDEISGAGLNCNGAAYNTLNN